MPYEHSDIDAAYQFVFVCTQVGDFNCNADLSYRLPQSVQDRRLAAHHNPRGNSVMWVQLSCSVNFDLEAKSSMPEGVPRAHDKKDSLDTL